MGNIPLPALAIKPPAAPPNALEQYAQMMGLKNEMQMQPLRIQQAQQSLQAGQMQNTMNQRMMDSQNALMNAWASSKGDMNQAMQAAQASGKVLPQDLMGFQEKSLAIQNQAAQLVAAKGKQAASDADAWAGAAQQVGNANPQERPQVYQQVLQNLAQGGHNVSQLPPQYPGDQQFQKMSLGVMSLSQAVKNQLDLSKIQGEQAEHGSLTPQQVQALNAGLAQRYSVLNPNKPVPDNLQLGANATPDDFNRIDKLMEGTEKSQQTAQQMAANIGLRKQTLDMMSQFRQQQLSLAQDNSLSKGFDYANTFINQKMQPLQQLSQRIGRLNKAILQGDPQSDSMIAPELLSITTGGPGSGLRMNEAEIDRVVGGATKWTQLKQNLNKWSLDPSKAQIPPEQRAQIQKLVDYIQGQTQNQLNIGMDAQQKLLTAKSLDDYHKTITDFSNHFSNAVQGKSAPVGQADEFAQFGGKRTSQ